MPSRVEIRKAQQRALEKKRSISAECLAAVMAIVLQFLPNRTQFGVILAAVAIASLLIYPVIHLRWIVEVSSKFIRISRLLGALALMLAGVGLYGWYVWPAPHRHTLSPAERAAFEAPLRELKKPGVNIRLACAPNDEIDCEYAADLIPLFGEAGWDISSEVDRVTLARPEAGVMIAKLGLSKKRPEKWNDGAWLKMTPDIEKVYQSFSNIGIEPDSTTGPDIPEDQMNIYVGHERENESSETMLTRSIEQMRHTQKEGPPKEPKP